MHYYQFNIGDYASHTRHLNPIEDIAYRRLLDAYYLQERPLNAGISSVARQINMREHEDEVKLVLEEFFLLTEDGWVNQRADKEINHYKAKVEQASRAGKASAERRSNSRSTDVQPTNNQEPITIVEAKPKQSRGTRLPADWVPTEDQIQFCKTHRTDLSPQTTADRFRDYWSAQPGAKGVKLDWDATWRNWVRAERASPTAQAAGSRPSWDRRQR
jgi:uncharacterized protein YdaU (DUF1376 family)